MATLYVFDGWSLPKRMEVKDISFAEVDREKVLFLYGGFGSQAVILPQILRAAGMRSEAAAHSTSWRMLALGQKQPLS